MIGRIVIDDVRPRTPTGVYPAKAVVGEKVVVSADIFRDGHEPLAACVRWAPGEDGVPPDASSAPMVAVGNDRWEGIICVPRVGLHHLVVEAWTDSPDVSDLTRSPPLPVRFDRERALVGAWYELFPRSEGGLRKAADSRLEAVAEMGFDVVYLPPIHPIGTTNRKGPDNTLMAEPNDPGSPWAIGSAQGGHTAVDPGLGTIEDFDYFVEVATGLHLEVALDYALQCSPDHPWVVEHPEWFHHRSDGTIRYAENPPKRYEDIFPLNFWPDGPGARQAMWEACRAIFEFWIEHGVRIFRVDNPHTKPMAFWEWVIPEVQRSCPEVVFLAEAFTRPKVMAKLAEVGFSQSYTYFTWRSTKSDLATYLNELCHGPASDYMRPAFWTNTPDILGGPLRNGPPAAFGMRLVLAATMVGTYGIYSGYELCENEPASDENEEYLHSEKYEIRRRHWDDPRSIAPLVTRLNEVRRRHPAFARRRRTVVHGSSNDSILVYSRCSDDGDDVMLMVVNLDFEHVQEDNLGLDLSALGMPYDRPYEAHDELSGRTWTWEGPNPYVRLDPSEYPAHVFCLRALS